MAADLRKLKRGRPTARSPQVLTPRILAALLLLAGCSTLEHQGGAPEISAPAPVAAPKTLAETPNEAERKRLTALYGGEYRWPKAEAYLNEVLVKLAKA